MKRRKRLRDYGDLWRNRIIMVVLFVLSGILVGFHGGAASYLLFYTSILLPLLSLAYLAYVFFRFRIYQYIENRVMVKGEKVPYRFVLANEDKLVTFTNVNVVFEERKSTVENVVLEKSYCLIPGERVDWQTTLSCRYRGEYTVGIDKVIVRDFLNLFELTYGIPSRIQIRVLPRVVHLHKLTPVPDTLDEKRQSRRILTKQNVPDVEIRRYAAGDPMKRIHWKNSARQQTLLTRKYTEEPKPGVILYLDLTATQGTEFEIISVEDKVIETALAMADYFYRHGTPVRAVYESNGIKELRVSTKTDFDMFYHACSEAVFYSSLEPERLVDAGIMAAGGSAGLEDSAMVVTHTLTDGLLRACMQMREYGSEMTVFYIGEGDMSQKTDKLGSSVHFYQIWPEQDITEVLER